MDDSPRMKAYGEFLEFYKLTGLYDVQYTTPGSYGKLLAAIGCGTEKVWTEEDRRHFLVRGIRVDGVEAAVPCMFVILRDLQHGSRRLIGRKTSVQPDVLQISQNHFCFLLPVRLQ